MSLKNLLDKIGPVKITFDGSEIGYAEDGPELVLEPEYRKRTTVDHGATAADFIHVGDRCEIRLKVAEWTLNNLLAAYPPGYDGTTNMGFGRSPGTRLEPLAKELVLHPLDAADDDTTRDVVIHKAVAVSKIEIGLNTKNERVFEVTFAALPDTNETDGVRLGRINVA